MPNKIDRKGVKTFNICVDDFFTNPDIIVDFAETLDYYPTPNGRWPGDRTIPLHMIDEDLNTHIVSKIIRAHFPGHKNEISWERSTLGFHKNKSWGDTASDEGWVHVDEGEDIAGLIYLTPGCPLETGTNIYHLKDEWRDKHDDSNTDDCSQKLLLYSGSPDFDKKKYNKQLRDYNNRFEVVSKFNNVYNRMIMWSGDEYHGAQSFQGYEDEERLTLLFFIGGVTVDNIPPMNYVRAIDKDIESFISRHKPNPELKDWRPT